MDLLKYWGCWNIWWYQICQHHQYSYQSINISTCLAEFPRFPSFQQRWCRDDAETMHRWCRDDADMIQRWCRDDAEMMQRSCSWYINGNIWYFTETLECLWTYWNIEHVGIYDGMRYFNILNILMNLSTFQHFSEVPCGSIIWARTHDVVNIWDAQRYVAICSDMKRYAAASLKFPMSLIDEWEHMMFH